MIQPLRNTVRSFFRKLNVAVYDPAIVFLALYQRIESEDTTRYLYTFKVYSSIIHYVKR